MQSWSSATGRSGTASADPRPEAPASEFEAVPRHQCRNGIRLDWSSIGAPAPSRALRLPGHPRRRPGPPAGRRLAGARAVDLAGDGCPLPDGARARPMTSQSLIRMNQDVPGHTPQALARSPGVPPAHACSARPAQTSSSGSGHPSRPMALREGVRPQDPRAHLCDPSLSCPLRTRRVPPHLGHASGSPPALPGPSGTCARRSPMSLLLSSCARPPRLSRYHVKHPRVSLRHVFSLTTSWRRRGAPSCRRRSKKAMIKSRREARDRGGSLSIHTSYLRI